MSAGLKNTSFILLNLIFDVICDTSNIMSDMSDVDIFLTVILEDVWESLVN